MALATNALPFGLRDVKLKSIANDGVGTRGAAVDLPVSRTFSFADTEDFEELRGDDKLAAVHGSGSVVDWELESGGISLDAYKIMAGGAVVSSGTTPNVKKTYTKLSTDARPYFQVEGQAISDSGGDFHTIVYRCKATESLEGEHSDGAFWITSASGQGIAESELAGALEKVYEHVHNETAAAIV